MGRRPHRSLGTLGLRSTMSYKRDPRLVRAEAVLRFLAGGLVLGALLYAIVAL